MGRAGRGKTGKASQTVSRPAPSAGVTTWIVVGLAFAAGVVVMAIASRGASRRGAGGEATRASPADSSGARALLAQARTLMDAHQPAEAQGILEKARALAPQDADVAFLLGSVAHSMRQMEVAEEHYRRAAALDPQRVETHVELAIVLLQQGQAREAAAAARQALTMRPGAPQIEALLGQALLRLGELPEAAERLETAHSKGLRGPEICAALGRARSLTGKTAAADQAFEEALGKDPQHPLVRYWHAEHLRASGRRAEARNEFEASRRCEERMQRLMGLEWRARAHPTELPTLVELAQVEAERGYIGRAVAAVRSIEALAPQHPELPRLKALLERAASSGQDVESQ